MDERTFSIERLAGQIGATVGLSDWVLVDQDKIDAFAAISGDYQPIHVDPVAAAQSPFGGTIAHGFLTLSLVSTMIQSALPPIPDGVIALNYGINAVRFLTPVRAGRRIRGEFTLADLTERSPGSWRATYGVTVAIEGEKRPAAVAELLVLYSV